MAVSTSPVTGSVKDVQLRTTSPYQLRLKFQLDKASSVESTLIPTIPAYAALSGTDSFTIGLIPTDRMDGDRKYLITLQWLDPDSGWAPIDHFEWEIRVPTGGGNLGDFLGFPLAPYEIWVVPGGKVPESAVRGDLLFDPLTDDLFRIG